MRILITGVAGFIGSNLANRLISDGNEVVGIDNLSAGVQDNVNSKVEFHNENICSSPIYSLFNGVDSVFHLAAKNCLSDCLEDPVETAEVNVAGTANVLEAARRAGVGKVVYADTSAEYEGVLEFPSKVGNIAPISVYASSKRAGAMFLETYQRFHGMRVTVLRYFNVYGPAQDWRRTVPPLMSAFIIKLLKGERPIIYGTGEKRRDFIYIDDVTEFNLLALMDPRTDSGVYNVGSGVNYSVQEIFDLTENILKTNIKPEFKDNLSGEADITLAGLDDGRELGWEPQVGLREGIECSINYIKENVLDESRGVGGG